MARLMLRVAVSHLQGITLVIKPMATLIITHRLASLQTVEVPSKAAVCVLTSLPYTTSFTPEALGPCRRMDARVDYPHFSKVTIPDNCSHTPLYPYLDHRCTIRAFRPLVDRMGQAAHFSYSLKILR